MFEIEEFSNAGNIHFAILPIFARIGGASNIIGFDSNTFVKILFNDISVKLE